MPTFASAALAAAASVEVTAPEVTREGDIVGPTVDVAVTAPSNHAAIEVMVSDIDLFFNDPGLVLPPTLIIDTKVCTEGELPFTDS